MVFRGKEVLTDVRTGGHADIEVPAGCIAGKVHDRGNGLDAVEVDSSYAVPEGYAFRLVREYFAAHDDDSSVPVARMKGLLGWRMSTKYCCACGHPLEDDPKETALHCPHCGKTHYPRVEPCIITIVEKADQMLLLRHKLRNQDLWCCLAGFVEVGESLEHALRREILEETGLEVDNIRYMGSQSWPFPDQLMVAFYADYRSGELKVQEEEISEARWFPKDEIPISPEPGSISWKLIHHTFQEYGTGISKIHTCR